jgi:iron-only hydrogenase group A
MKTINLTVNDQPVEVKTGETILSAIREAGFNVPTLCNLDCLPPTGACRMCAVEVDGSRNLVPSCAYPATDGMTVATHTPRTERARKTIVELLLSNHPDDCLYCPRNGQCELQTLARELGVTQRNYNGGKNKHDLDLSGASIVRDPAKCILCGRCVRYCEEVQGVGAIDFIGRGSQATVGTAFDQGLNLSSCINCGQCAVVCPTGALREQDHVSQVVAALADPAKTVVVQHAPAISVTLAEEFGVKPGTDINGQLNAALRRLGFERVFDTSFSADLTIMEEAAELVQRVQTGGVLPQLTSCSPGWIKFVEQTYPELLPNVSSCKSPQQMLGAVIKHVFAKQEGKQPEEVYSVSVMPCTAKKFEAQRPEMAPDGIPDVDAVLTTRELAALLRMRGIDLGKLEPEAADQPFGERSSAGKLFGASGGVMEAALRTAYHLITGGELEQVKFRELRGLKGSKEARVKIGDLEVGVAVVSGLDNARVLLEEVQAGRQDLHFIEVMTCPGGCIAGGGQPLNTDLDRVRARMKALYTIDRDAPVKRSHENRAIQRLYHEFLGAPLSEASHHLLHTRYTPREVVH